MEARRIPDHDDMVPAGDIVTRSSRVPNSPTTDEIPQGSQPVDETTSIETLSQPDHEPVDKRLALPRQDPVS